MIAINTILDKLQTDMQDNIDPTNDYSTKPSIKRGIYTARDLEGTLPAVCFICYSEGTEPYMKTEVAGMIYVRLYGFTSAESKNGGDDVKELAHDVLSFIYSSDWTYYDKTDKISNIAYLEPTLPNQPIGEFVFDIRIRDDSTYSILK